MSVNVFSTKALIGRTISTSTTGDGTAAAAPWSSEPCEVPAFIFQLIYDPEYWSGTGNISLCRQARALPAELILAQLQILLL